MPVLIKLTVFATLSQVEKVTQGKEPINSSVVRVLQVVGGAYLCTPPTRRIRTHRHLPPPHPHSTPCRTSPSRLSCHSSSPPLCTQHHQPAPSPRPLPPPPPPPSPLAPPIATLGVPRSPDPQAITHQHPSPAPPSPPDSTLLHIGPCRLHSSSVLPPLYIPPRPTPPHPNRF